MFILKTFILVGGLDFLFSVYWEFIMPTDFHIFQDGKSTTNQY